MAFLRHELLARGTAERITGYDMEPVDIGSVFERVIKPLQAGQTPAIHRGTGYTARGTASATRLQLTVFDEGVPVAVLGVCLRARDSAGLWAQVHEIAGWTPAGDAPPAPWSALAELMDQSVLPDWLRYWAKSVAYSLLVHSTP